MAPNRVKPVQLKEAALADPKEDLNLKKLNTFLGLFGCFIDFRYGSKLKNWLKALTIFSITVICSDTIYDINLRQSKLLAEQKRSTPLLTFMIVLYSLTSFIALPVCDLYLMYNSSRLFRFYNKTIARLCNGKFLGKKTTVDTWYFYSLLILLAILDSVGQVFVLGVWPPALQSPLESIFGSKSIRSGSRSDDLTKRILFKITSNSTESSQISIAGSRPLLYQDVSGHLVEQLSPPTIRNSFIDSVLGEQYADGNLGVTLKLFVVVVHYIHLNAGLLIVVSFASHFANVIDDINTNLDSYDFRTLLRELIVLREASESMSFLCSPIMSTLFMYYFCRLCALCGVFLQSTMQFYENFAICLQILASVVVTYLVFAFCDGLESNSRQIHRLKMEQVVAGRKKKANQHSLYELLDYLNRLTKSIRVTFFNIFGIDKGSSVGFFGHVLTLTFVTS